MKGILIDTNVFVRFLLKDVEKQFEEAERLFKQVEEEEVVGYISILVINEIIWILENYYELERKIFLPELLKLLAIRNMKIVEIKKGDLVKILEKMQESKIDFTDIYLTVTKGDHDIFSFDADFQKL